MRAPAELVIACKIGSASEEPIERKGMKTWRVTVPASAAAKLTFGLALEAED
jgi:hypothetical protein